MMPTGSPFYPGQRLTDFSMVDITVERVASGGFGVVAMGPNHRDDEIWCALKTIRPEILARSPRVRDLFIREALIWMGVWPHVNVLPAQFVTEINDLPCILLMYAQHGNMRDILERRDTPPLALGLRWARDIATGLQVLHTPDPAFLRSLPIIHRDLKPENVLVGEPGFAMVTDFGLSKLLDEDHVDRAELGMIPPDASEHQVTGLQPYQTQRGVALGTPPYMAPEQWEDAAQVGPAADVYAFGLILSELLAGRHGLLDLTVPHGQQEWHQAHTQQTPRSLLQVVPTLPRAVEDLYQACLAKRPEARPTAAEAKRTLEEALQAIGRDPKPIPEGYPHTRENETARWDEWAVAYARFDLFDEALVRSDRSFALSPHDVDVLLNRGMILKGLHRPNDALALYESALAQLPKDDLRRRSLVLDARGNTLKHMQRFAEADAAFAEALALRPDAAPCWHNRASNQGLWAGAEIEAQHIGEACMHLQRAKQYIEQAIRLSDNPTYYPILAFTEEGIKLWCSHA